MEGDALGDLRLFEIILWTFAEKKFTEKGTLTTEVSSYDGQRRMMLGFYIVNLSRGKGIGRKTQTVKYKKARLTD